MTSVLWMYITWLSVILSGWQSTFRLYLRNRCSRLPRNVLTTQPDEHDWCLIKLCSQCAGVLSATHGSLVRDVHTYITTVSSYQNFWLILCWFYYSLLVFTTNHCGFLRFMVLVLSDVLYLTACCWLRNVNVPSNCSHDTRFIWVVVIYFTTEVCEILPQVSWLSSIPSCTSLMSLYFVRKL